MLKTLVKYCRVRGLQRSETLLQICIYIAIRCYEFKAGSLFIGKQEISQYRSVSYTSLGGSGRCKLPHEARKSVNRADDATTIALLDLGGV